MLQGRGIQMRRETTFSACRAYRYVLWREFGGLLDDSRYVMFIGLNPSTADETNDDPTVRRCIGYTSAWGYGALCMTNLFALRATDPALMLKADDPVGPDNDTHLVEFARGADVIVAAWGSRRGEFRLASSCLVSRSLPFPLQTWMIFVASGPFSTPPLFRQMAHKRGFWAAQKRQKALGFRRRALIYLGFSNLKSRLILARPAGIEPATPAFGGQYSIH
jgi:hypothetical protein